MQVALGYLRCASLVLAGAVAIIIFNYCVVFTGPLPDHHLLAGWNDVILHCGAFGILTVLGLSTWRPGGPPLMVLATFAALTEAAQVFRPQRTASFTDFAANAAGIALGLLIVLAGRVLVSRFAERAARSAVEGTRGVDGPQ